MLSFNFDISGGSVIGGITGNCKNQLNLLYKSSSVINVQNVLNIDIIKVIFNLKTVLFVTFLPLH